MTSRHLETEVFAAFLDRTRWFGGKGRPYAVTDVRTLGELPGGPPVVVIHLVEVTYSDEEGGTELYQVPLVVLRATRRPGSTTRSSAGGRTPTTAGSTPTTRCTTATRWRCGSGPSTGRPRRGGLRFHRLPGHELDLEAHSTLFSGEQSNSSVAFGEDALMKVFRKVTPGANPDIRCTRC